MNKKKVRQQKDMIIGNNSYRNDKKIDYTDGDKNGVNTNFLKHKRTHVDKEEINSNIHK